MSLFAGVWKSLQHAVRGLALAFKTERSFRVQIAAALVLLIIILTFPMYAWERVALLLAAAAVLVLELLNSTVERLVDLAKPRLSQYVRDIKDLMAAAVLVASIFALIVGLIVLIPYVRLLVA